MYFRHFQFCVVDYPPAPLQKYKFGSGAGEKMTTFSLTEKRKRRKAQRKEGRKEKREEGKKGGRKERKEAKNRM